MSVVYFGKIKKFDDERVVVKIGCTSNISEVVGKFPSMEIFSIFQCDNQESFTEFLHGHKDISLTRSSIPAGSFA